MYLFIVIIRCDSVSMHPLQTCQRKYAFAIAARAVFYLAFFPPNCPAVVQRVCCVWNIGESALLLACSLISTLHYGKHRIILLFIDSFLLFFYGSDYGLLLILQHMFFLFYFIFHAQGF